MLNSNTSRSFKEYSEEASEIPIVELQVYNYDPQNSYTSPDWDAKALLEELGYAGESLC